MVQSIEPAQHHKPTAARLNGLFENIAVSRLVGQPGAPSEARISDGQLRGQTGTAFSATGLDNQSTTLGRHAGTKAVGALAMQIAGLKGPLHDGDPRSR